MSSDVIPINPYLQEICDSPKLVVDGVGPNDLNQGSLGNCWFIAACTSLSLDQKAWNRVVPDVNHQVSVYYYLDTDVGQTHIAHMYLYKYHIKCIRMECLTT